MVGKVYEVHRRFGLVVTCWPDSNLARAFFGMSTYSTLAMLYLAYVGLNGGMGILLWPAVAVHVGLSVLSFERGGTKENTGS